MGEEQGTINIFELELHLNAKMNESESKTKQLEELQEELLKVRQELITKEIELEVQKRTINDLQIQLASSRQLIELIEKEKAKYMNERIQLQINCDVALKERESLLEQTHVAKLENYTLKWNLQQSTDNLANTEADKKELQETLLEMRNRLAKIQVNFQSNVTKLEKEHQLLLKSVESATKLNKRLQTVGLCTHAIYTKKNEEINELQKKLVMKTQANVPPQTDPDFDSSNKINKFDAKAYIEQVRLDMESHVATDKEIEALLTEFDSD